MKVTKPIIALFLSLVAFFSEVNGQEALDLRSLVNLALEENYQIRIATNNVDVAKNANTVGNASMLPNVDVNAERRLAVNNSQQQFFTGDSQEATNAKRNATSASIGATWVVFDGLAMFGRKDRLAQLEALSEADRRFFIEQTVSDLANTYYILKQETQLLDAYRKSLEVSQSRLRLEKKSLEIGASNKLDFQLALANRNTDSALVVGQEARIQELTISINRIVNRELTAPIQPVDSIELNREFDLAELRESAKQNNAMLDQQQLQELIAMSETKIFKGALFPEVEVFGNYSFDRQTNEVGFLESSRTFGPDVGVRVRFNLFTGGQERIASRNAVISLENEELRTAELSQEVEAALETAYVRWESSRRQALLEQESVEASLEAFKIAQGQYDLGAITIVDFRVIQLNAINAESRFLRAAYEAKSREIELLRISGRLIDSVM
ncbi:MAG: TolC family protein [Cryomorphaceae bacterium]